MNSIKRQATAHERVKDKLSSLSFPLYLELVINTGKRLPDQSYEQHICSRIPSGEFKWDPETKPTLMDFKNFITTLSNAIFDLETPVINAKGLDSHSFYHAETERPLMWDPHDLRQFPCEITLDYWSNMIFKIWHLQDIGEWCPDTCIYIKKTLYSDTPSPTPSRSPIPPGSPTPPSGSPTPSRSPTRPKSPKPPLPSGSKKVTPPIMLSALTTPAELIRPLTKSTLSPPPYRPKPLEIFLGHRLYIWEEQKDEDEEDEEDEI